MKRIAIIASLLFAVAVWSLTIASMAQGADITLSDGEFESSHWTRTVLGSGGGCNGVAYQSAAGGNPGAFRYQATTFSDPSPLIWSWIIDCQYNTAQPYTPSASGSIDYLTFQEARVVITPVFPGSEVGTAVGLMQDSKIFWGPYSAYGNLTWETYQWAPLNAGDFTEHIDTYVDGVDLYIIRNENSHPDFSVTGGPIYFAYFRLNSHRVPSTLEFGLDNWEVTIHLDSPATPIIDAVVDAGTGDKLILKWSHPDPADVTHYEVRAEEVGGTPSGWTQVDGGETNYCFIDGLIEHTEYNVSIRACNEGVYSEIVTTTEPVRPTTPVFLVHGIFRTATDWDIMKVRLDALGFNYVYAVGGLQKCGFEDEEHFSGNATALSGFIDLRLAVIEVDIEAYTDMSDFHIENIDIIAHSMGGLVSRRYISETSAYWGMGNRNRHARNFIMLGTPNNGSASSVLGKIIGDIDNRRLLEKCGDNPGPALREMWPDKMNDFNDTYYDNPSTVYYAVYGSRGSCWYCNCYGIWGGIFLYKPNDGAVSMHSVVRDKNPGFGFDPHYTNYHSDATHPDKWCHSYGGNSNYYYLGDETLVSQYIYPILTGRPAPVVKPNMPDIESEIPPQFVYTKVDSLLLGQSASGSLTVESNTSFSIRLLAVDPLITFSLESPFGVPYDYSSTTPDSSVVYYDDGEGIFSFFLEGAETGLWQWSVDASSCTESVIPFVVMAVIESDVVVMADQNSEDVHSDEQLNLIVEVLDGGIGLAGLSVTGLPIWNYMDTSSVANFLDDGLHEDGAADDGKYGLVLSTFPDTGFVEFQVTITGTASLGQINRQVYMHAFVDEPPCCVPPIRGNVNYDLGDNIDISDLVYLVDYMFNGGPEPACLDEADINGSGELDISDLVFLVDYMFTGGPPPVACP